MLIFFTILIGSTHTTQSTIHVDEQMKSLLDRLSVYSMYLHGNYTRKERNVIIKAALKDGAIATAGSLGIYCIFKWKSLLENLINIPASLYLETQCPRNIPVKYQQLFDEVEKIKSNQPLTIETAKKWVKIYSEIREYNELGWIIPEDKNTEVPYYAKIGALNNELYELFWDKKIIYADNEEQLYLIDHFVQSKHASKEALLYRVV